MNLQRKNAWGGGVVELLLITCLFFEFVLPVVPQAGFVSLNCGGDGDIDIATPDITWLADSTFLDSLRELEEMNVTMSANVRPPVGAKSGHSKTTARVFIPSRTSPSKYCYTLDVEFQDSSTAEQLQYLLRVVFPSWNLFSLSAKDNDESLTAEFSTRFYFTVDSTYIATINLDPIEAQTIELIVSSLDRNMYVCLVPLEDRSSLVAISSLELRPLGEGMYARTGAPNGLAGTEIEGSNKETTYLMMVARLDFGGTNTLKLRYPEDPYDRIWTSPEVPPDETQVVEVYRNTTVAAEEDHPGFDLFPQDVLGTFWEGTSLESNISFQFDTSAANALRPLPTFYMTIWFRDINPGITAEGSRRLDITLEGSLWASNVSALQDRAWLIYNRKQVLESTSPMFTISANEAGSLPPIVNAFEVYGEFPAKTVRTAGNDVIAIKRFSKIGSEHLDRAGDPCLPTPWNWLVCSIETIPQITQINLTSKGVRKGYEQDLDTIEFGNLSRLTVLDLSSNGFSGDLPKALGDVTTLNTLDLNNNNFSGAIPEEIGSLINLKSLDLSSNSFNELKIDLRKLSKLTDLNLANNKLEGMVPESVWDSNVVNVNLTNNKFEELNLTIWIRDIPTSGAGSFQKKVRLLDNLITKVYPDLDLPSTSEKIRPYLTTSSQAFVLLGNNSQWCSARAANPTFIVKHLCRTSEFDPLDPKQDENVTVSKRVVVIIALVCGICGLIMITLFLLALWRIRRRQLELRKIQEELGKQDVWPPIFSYDDLKTATKGFSQQSELGRGAFAAVYKAELQDGTKVAVKKLFTAKQEIADFVKELVLITGIKHKHLIQLKGCCIREKQWMLVYEYADNKNLAEALWGDQRSFTLSWTQRVNICLGIARGLQYLLEELHPKIIHRDIKPENILLDKDFNAKIADFGLARNADPDENDDQMVTRRCAGTMGYLPPEYATQGMVTEKLDVYSYGVLVLEIVSGRRCINVALTENPEQMYLRDWAIELCKKDMLLDVLDKQLSGNCPQEEVLVVLKMALSCIQDDWTKRPSMSQVVNTLMVNKDIAVDIVQQLKGQTPSYSHLFDDDGRTSAYNHTVKFGETELQERALLYSSSTSGGSRQSMYLAKNVTAR